MRTESKEILMIFGQNVKKARESRNMTIKEVAQKAVYDRNSLSKLEFGEQNIKLSTALKIADVLDVSFPELFLRRFMIQKESIKGYQEDDYLRVFIENFQKKMKSQGYLQMNVYIQVGIDEASISRILQRKNVNPTLLTLNTMAIAINAEISDLFVRN